MGCARLPSGDDPGAGCSPRRGARCGAGCHGRGTRDGSVGSHSPSRSDPPEGQAAKQTGGRRAACPAAVAVGRACRCARPGWHPAQAPASGCRAGWRDRSARRACASGVDRDVALGACLGAIRRVRPCRLTHASIPPFGWNRCTVQRGPAPVDLPCSLQMLQEHPVQRGPDPGLLPVAQASPAAHARPAAHLGGQHLPRQAGLEHEQDAGQRRPVRKAWTAALRPGWFKWQQRRDRRPKVVGYKQLGLPRTTHQSRFS